MTSSEISFEDYLALSKLVFEWADSYDGKDWERLKAILAPDLEVDYMELTGEKYESMPATDFVALVSNLRMLGSHLLRTQHLVGASKWEKENDDLIFGYHQIRSGSVLSDPESKDEPAENYRWVIMRHIYNKVDGQWKLAGLKPMKR